MKAILLAISGAFLIFCGPAQAADKASVKDELKDLIAKVNDKIKSGSQDAKDYAAELKEFDAIVARHAAEKSDEVAEVLFMKASLYMQVLDENEKAAEIFKKLQAKFPDTKPGAAAADALQSLERQQGAGKLQAALKVGAPFPPFEVKDMNGKPFSLAAVKGKVVLIDFWATWCMPCVMELPNVQAAYKKFHDKGFEVLGISLDEDKAELEAFLTKREMTWPQYFDGKGWQNALAEKYGITSIPATFLLDGKGVIIGRGLRGEELEAAVAKALGAN